MESDASQSTATVAFLAWVEVNKQRLLIGGVAALIIFFVAFMFIQHQAQKETTASEALSNVRLPFSAAVAPAPSTAEALFKVANEHKGTKAAGRALLISAGVLFSEAKSAQAYADAQQRFTQVTQDYPDSPWSAQAHLGIAASLAAQGKSAEATSKYEEVRRRFGTSSVGDEAKLALARLYEGPKSEEAFKLYEELLKENPNSALAMEAGMRQSILLESRPELAKLREPVTPPPSMPQPPSQQIKINPVTNRVTTAVSNAADRLGTNLQRLTITNRPGTSQPVQIKLNPAPAPGATSPAPAK
jgi:predicted negative regulator of RcsB-dependent stress response